MTKRSPRPPILKPNETYTFRSYFLMKFAPADILQELGASLVRETINLPMASFSQFTRLADLRQQLELPTPLFRLTYRAIIEII